MVDLYDPRKTVECESFTIGNIAVCNESWLQLFHTDGNTGEMDSHTEQRLALLVTLGIVFFIHSPPLFYHQLIRTPQTSQLG